MAEVKMTYIILQKQNHESKTIKDLVLQVLDDVSEFRNDTLLEIEGISVQYRIGSQQENSKVYLEIRCVDRANRAVATVEKVNSAIFSSPMQRYFEVIKDFDGVSNYYGNKLYPKCAEFERNIRRLVLLILTEAYGTRWRDETVPSDMLNEIKETAHGNVSLSLTLENMDLSMLEAYLFDEQEVDYVTLFNNQLSHKQIEKMSASELRGCLEMMRPTSLWNKHFNVLGLAEEWEKRIKEIHNVRNKVAHHKTISKEEYVKINRKLSSLNRDLNSAIYKIREECFTNEGVVDVLANFAFVLDSYAQLSKDSKGMKVLLTSLYEKIKESAKPIEHNIKAQYCYDFTLTIPNLQKEDEKYVVAETYSKSVDIKWNLLYQYWVMLEQKRKVERMLSDIEIGNKEIDI